MPIDRGIAVVEAEAEQSQDTGMRVDQTGTDTAIGREAKVVGCALGQRPEIMPDGTGNRRQATALQKIVEADIA